MRLPLLCAALACSALLAQDGPRPPRGPFGLTRLSTASGSAEPVHAFSDGTDCALCHTRQVWEFQGSMHSAAHVDPLYRAFAELARREAGEEVYTYCAGCHSPAGVASGAIPHTPEGELPPVAKAGVTCDVCHQVGALSGADGPWGEPANASLVLAPSRTKGGPYGDIQENPGHQGEQRDFLTSSEFCASCHTVVHPVNGLRIEHTYAEWKASVYAENGVQCQDCHMRSVDDARRVAETLQPVVVRGTSAVDAGPREIAVHAFVGGNVDAERLHGGARHARAAEERLRSAAALAVTATAAGADRVAFDVVVQNVGAGHDLPTSLTELREMWIHVRVTDAAGRLVFESGAPDEHGELPPDTERFGAGLLDAEGRPTIKPWEATAFAWKRTVPPKGEVRVAFAAPRDGARGPLAVRARLLYRIAPPHVVALLLGADAPPPTIALMAEAEATLAD